MLKALAADHLCPHGDQVIIGACTGPKQEGLVPNDAEHRIAHSPPVSRAKAAGLAQPSGQVGRGVAGLLSCGAERLPDVIGNKGPLSHSGQIWVGLSGKRASQKIGHAGM